MVIDVSDLNEIDKELKGEINANCVWLMNEINEICINL